MVAVGFAEENTKHAVVSQPVNTGGICGGGLGQGIRIDHTASVRRPSGT